ncbi:hypothetical protein AKJ40_01655 [candidate division MSBL1 archaeon SCGC-AAA259M10]|uniref:Uncharacterized protein n=1 Tax=candidate division MSBL1 archaeon SCGC-AAA259M10 TaxID=1698270 RepID=A0A133V1A7_9EURY|nr:hypothetical protein AKJ40_01655 [candidate division MSBL1 archaeon SCGC-AAA259M10]
MTTEDVRKHYLRPDVKELLLEATELNDYRQALITGFAGWYRYRNENGKTEMALKPFKSEIYDKQIKTRMDEETRSLYWSTNFYDSKVFSEWIDKEKKDKNQVQKPGDYGTTGYYRLGIDIDLLDEEKLEELDSDRTVNDAESREMLEKAGQFVCDWFANHGLPYDALRPYFSGNGFYLTIDPSIAGVDCDAEKSFKICEAFNTLIKQIEKEFFEEEEDADKFVQFDALNNSSRAWKTILSIHKSKPYACIPLDPVDVEIDLEKAKLPLEEKVIEEVREWIQPTKKKYREKYAEKLANILKSKVIEEEDGKTTPFKIAERKRKKKNEYSSDKDFEDLDLEIEDLESLKNVLPPCLSTLIEGKNALSHARGKALLAKTLKAVGLERERASELFNKLTTEAGGPTTNIFESWYDSDMCLPSCEKINTIGTGYPSLEVGDLGICDPCELCEDIDNPFQYIKEESKPDSLKVIEEALESLDYNLEKIGRVWDNEEQEHYYYPVQFVFGDVSSTREALNRLRRDRIESVHSGSIKNNIDKPERKRVIAEAVVIDMGNKGKLLKGETGGKFYYHEKEKQVYRFNEIDRLLQRLYDISSTTQVGKITKDRIKNEIENNGEEVKVKKLWLWDREKKELYVYDKDRHYFVLNGKDIKKRPNGTNGVYFLFDAPENRIEYKPKEERNTDFEIPGKTSDDFKAGDCEINELLANQTNFTNTTNLSAEEQKLQLLLHCYTFPFSELIPAKPIMLFTGEKGSTKSFTLKKIGRFYMNPDYRARPLPSEEDYYVAVTKYPFTFLDNVEDKPTWLEDGLARVATEVEIAKRKLYEDFKEAKRKPDTFLGLTAREIKFNRDDVMDRSLLFHAKRIPEGSFLREEDLEKPLHEHRHTLWSQYLDNLNRIVKKLQEGGLKGKQSNHRLADWACLAMEIAEALDFDEHYNIGRIFDKMETERAAYTLKDSEVYQTIKQAKAAGTLKHDTWLPASEIVGQLQDANQHFSKSAETLGRELNQHEKEYGEIFGLEIKQQRDRKAYYFPSPDSGNTESGTCEECGLVEGKERETENGEIRVLCGSCYGELGFSASTQPDSKPEVEQLGV